MLEWTVRTKTEKMKINIFKDFFFSFGISLVRNGVIPGVGTRRTRPLLKEKEERKGRVMKGGKRRDGRGSVCSRKKGDHIKLGYH